MPVREGSCRRGASGRSRVGPRHLVTAARRTPRRAAPSVFGRDAHRRSRRIACRSGTRSFPATGPLPRRSRSREPGEALGSTERRARPTPPKNRPGTNGVARWACASGATLRPGRARLPLRIRGNTCWSVHAAMRRAASWPRTRPGWREPGSRSWIAEQGGFPKGSKCLLQPRVPPRASPRGKIDTGTASVFRGRSIV